MLTTAIIGLGRICWLLEEDPYRQKPCTHMGGIVLANSILPASQQFELRYICDVNGSRLNLFQKKYSRAFPNLIAEDSYQKIIDQKPEVVIIAVNTQQHAEILEYAMKSNIPRIVIEKPICDQMKSLRRLKKAFNHYSGKIWINYERRRHANYLKLKQILDGKKIGEVLHYRATMASRRKNFFKNLENPNDEGLLLNDTTHLLDLCQFLFGQIATCKRVQTGSSSHLLALAHLQTSGTILSLKDSHYFHFDLEVFCEFGRIKIGNGYFEIQKKIKSNLYQNFTQLSAPKKMNQVSNDRKNPFCKLYLEVARNLARTSDFENAMENCRLLLENSR